MPWAKLDDSLYDNPKILEIGDRLLGVWVRMLSYCARHQTDGELTAAALRSLGVRDRDQKRLISARLLAEIRPGVCAINDWLEYNPSREETEAKRAAVRDRQRKFRASVTRDTTHDKQHPDPTRPDPIDPDHMSEVENSAPSSRASYAVDQLEALAPHWRPLGMCSSDVRARIAELAPVTHAEWLELSAITRRDATKPGWPYFAACLASRRADEAKAAARRGTDRVAVLDTGREAVAGEAELNALAAELCLLSPTRAEINRCNQLGGPTLARTLAIEHLAGVATPTWESLFSLMEGKT